MSGGYEVLVFAVGDTRPFALPSGFVWIPGGLHTRNGRVHPTMAVRTATREEAYGIAGMARNEGFRGVIRPRFKETNIAEQSAPQGATRRRLTDDGLTWLKQNDPSRNKSRRAARRARAKSSHATRAYPLR